jgi:class 3 adenylate cyclase
LDRAIDAALAVRNKVSELPAVSQQFSPKVSIGINSGEMISGNIGSATLRRLDYTVIGDTVNTAQRMQSVAKENQIIIGETAYMQVKEAFNCRKVGDVVLKNKMNPTPLYEVLD